MIFSIFHFPDTYNRFQPIIKASTITIPNDFTLNIEPPPLSIRGTPLKPCQSSLKRPRATKTTTSELSLPLSPPYRRPTKRAESDD